MPDSIADMGGDGWAASFRAHNEQPPLRIENNHYTPQADLLNSLKAFALLKDPTSAGFVKTPNPKQFFADEGPVSAASGWFQDDGQPSEDVLLRSAKKQFPILESLGMKYKNSPGRGKGFLEFWPPLEEGAPNLPRPKEFRLDEFGVEVYDPKTRPIDIMADVASHHLMQTDPTIKKHYEVFKDSMTKEQRIKLSEQYDHARKHEGEKRPFAQWADKTGIPGWFRGYAFEQWDHPEEIYTPDQMKRFDNMMDYLRKPR